MSCEITEMMSRSNTLLEQKRGGTIITQAEAKDIIIAEVEERGTIISRIKVKDMITAGAVAEDVINVVV